VKPNEKKIDEAFSKIGPDIRNMVKSRIREMVEVLSRMSESAAWWAGEISAGRPVVGAEGEVRTVLSLLAPYLERIATLEGQNALVAHARVIALTRIDQYARRRADTTESPIGNQPEPSPASIEAEPKVLTIADFNALSLEKRVAIVLGPQTGWPRCSCGQHATFAGANLKGANLKGANLAWANLAWANLTGANLAWANLTWANLTGADLTKANLAWANLTEADFEGS